MRKLAGFFILCAMIFLSPVYSAELDVSWNAKALETYNDNITSAKDNTMQDFITELIFGWKVLYQNKVKELEFSGNIHPRIFSRYSSYNKWSQDVNLVYKYELSKFSRLRVRNGFTHSDEPTDFDEEFEKASGRYDFYRNIFDLGYEMDVSKDFVFKTGYTNVYYTDSRSDSSSSYVNGIKLGGEYTLDWSDIILGNYEFTHRKFDPGSSALLHKLSGGLRKYLTKRLYWDNLAGVSLIDSFTDKKYARPYIYSSLNHELDGRKKAALAFTKQSDSNNTSEDILDSWRVNGSISGNIYQRFNGSLSVFYGEGKYNNSGIKDNFSGLNVSTSYDISRDVQLVMSYGYSITDSTFSSREYQRNTISMGVSANF